MRSSSSEESGSRLTAALIIASALSILAALLYPLLHSADPAGFTAAQAAVVTFQPVPSQPMDVTHLGLQRAHAQQAVLTAYNMQQATLDVQGAVVVVQQQQQQAAAAKAVQQQQAPPAASTPAASHVTVSASGFEACVIQRESGGDPTAYNSSSGASGLFGMLLSTWDSLGLGYPGGAYTAPVSVQEQGFAILYARDGTSPWAPYDGC